MGKRKLIIAILVVILLQGIAFALGAKGRGTLPQTAKSSYVDDAGLPGPKAENATLPAESPLTVYCDKPVKMGPPPAKSSQSDTQGDDYSSLLAQFYPDGESRVCKFH